MVHPKIGRYAWSLRCCETARTHSAKRKALQDNAAVVRVFLAVVERSAGHALRTYGVPVTQNGREIMSVTHVEGADRHPRWFHERRLRGRFWSEEGLAPARASYEASWVRRGRCSAARWQAQSEHELFRQVLAITCSRSRMNESVC